jgi:hypothetical protein
VSKVMIKVEEKIGDKTNTVYKPLNCIYCGDPATKLVMDKPFCRKHEDLLKFFMWSLQTIHISDELKTKSGIIVPGVPNVNIQENK